MELGKKKKKTVNDKVQSQKSLTDFKEKQLSSSDFNAVILICVGPDWVIQTFLKRTFPPACPRTAKQNRVDSSVLPSILNCAKPAACPSIGWDTFLSTEYSCMAPTTRFCWKGEKAKKLGIGQYRQYTEFYWFFVNKRGNRYNLSSLKKIFRKMTKQKKNKRKIIKYNHEQKTKGNPSRPPGPLLSDQHSGLP